MNLLRKKDILHSFKTTEELHRCLNAFDLTCMGIGAIIGAGIFILTGIVAATLTGPALVLSYLIAGTACAFSALSYAELAALVGGCGSAYGYAYVGLGEMVAWIVGWDLLLEYLISVSAISVGWGSYVYDLLAVLHIHLPDALSKSFLDGGIFDSLAVFIIAVLTSFLVLGVRLSVKFNILIVMIKLFVILLFIFIASYHVQPENWTPFMPFGWIGVMQGASLIFFAYIGFDAVSTAAEETIHPQRNLPIGIMCSLAICTVLYILVSLLLTGIIPYQSLNTASPISHALITIGQPLAASIISVGAIAGLTTVILVMYYGLTRVFLAMSRDGLLPICLSKVNKRTKTPIRIITICGILAGLISALLPIRDLAELVNVGTLFAFSIVCVGVLILRYTQPELPRPFKTPFMPFTPIMGLLSCLYLMYHLESITLLRFFIWMALGMIIYFSFSRKNSRLNELDDEEIKT